MAQFGRPSTDSTNQGYTDQAGGTTNIYTTLDETSADDADYIKTGSAPTADVYVTKFTTLEDPAASTGHVVRVRRRKSASGGAQIDFLAELRQGYANESSQGTLIATVENATDITDTWTTTAYSLTGTEADAITDYTDLYLRVRFNQV